MNVFTDNTLIIWLACVISHLKTSTHVKAARIKNKQTKRIWKFVRSCRL